MSEAIKPERVGQLPDPFWFGRKTNPAKMDVAGVREKEHPTTAKLANKATQMMLQWTMDFESGCYGRDDETYRGDEIRSQWQEDIRLYSDDYDREYYALVATPAIEKTIDWDWIAEEMNYWEVARFLFEYGKA